MERKNKISNGTYKSGVAIRTEQLAKEAVDKIKQNSKKNKNISQNGDKVCKYYPHFCKVVGHTNARCKECGMYRTTPEEKKKHCKPLIS